MNIVVALVFLLKILCVQSRPFGILDSIKEFGEDAIEYLGDVGEKIKEEIDDCIDDAKETYVDAKETFKGWFGGPAPNNDPPTEAGYDVNSSEETPFYRDDTDSVQKPVAHVPSQIPPRTPTKNPEWPSQIPTKNPTPKPQLPNNSRPLPISPNNSTPNPPSRPQPPKPSVIPSLDTTENPPPHPQPTDPSQIPTENPLLQPQPSIPSQTPPFSNTTCTCTPFFRCYDEETSSNLTGIIDDRTRIPVKPKSCPDPNDVCCHNLVQPQPQNPSSMSPDVSTNNPSPKPQNPSQISPNNSTQLPPSQPESPGTPRTILEESTESPSLEPLPTIAPSPSIESEPTIAPDIFPSDVNCICTQFFRCYDEETSNNLASVADRQESCPDPNEVCCHNLVQPESPTTNNSLPQPHPQYPSSMSPDVSTHKPSPQPQDPTQLSPNNSTQVPPSEPDSPGTPRTILEDSTERPSLEPLPTIAPSPSIEFEPTITPSTSSEPEPTIAPDIFTSDVNCTCTPLFRCYDEETSSNLASVADGQKSCFGSNDICCYNLNQPLLTQSTASPIPVNPKETSEKPPRNPDENPRKG